MAHHHREGLVSEHISSIYIITFINCRCLKVISFFPVKPGLLDVGSNGHYKLVTLMPRHTSRHQHHPFMSGLRTLGWTSLGCAHAFSKCCSWDPSPKVLKKPALSCKKMKCKKFITLAFHFRENCFQRWKQTQGYFLSEKLFLPPFTAESDFIAESLMAIWWTCNSEWV